jgi:hypothetical protein
LTLVYGVANLSVESPEVEREMPKRDRAEYMRDYMKRRRQRQAEEKKIVDLFADARSNVATDIWIAGHHLTVDDRGELVFEISKRGTFVLREKRPAKDRG